jgi:uncharacterized protein YlzI (FlbEa/FlbD family)
MKAVRFVMLCLTRLNGTQVYVSPIHIVTVEATPDTLVCLHNGDRMLVRERAAEVAGMLGLELRGEQGRALRLVPPVIDADDTN